MVIAKSKRRRHRLVIRQHPFSVEVAESGRLRVGHTTVSRQSTLVVKSCRPSIFIVPDDYLLLLHTTSFQVGLLQGGVRRSLGGGAKIFCGRVLIIVLVAATFVEKVPTDVVGLGLGG